MGHGGAVSLVKVAEFMDFKQLTKILYVMFYATVTSGPMAEHNNGRLKR